MRDWATKETADWWVKADHNYKERLENQPSEDYLVSRARFDSYLEVGSGTGRLIKLLNGKRGAIDINNHLLNTLPPEIVKYNIDISRFLIPIDRYELVFCFQVLQHLNHERFLRALDNMKKIATKEIWLFEGQVAGAKDGDLTHPTGSYHHDYTKYLDCYQIDSLHGGKIMIYRSKIK